MVKKCYNYIKNILPERRDNMRLILTSAGLKNKKFAKIFVNFTGRDAKDIKALFIPTAAISTDAVGALPQCIYDLIKCGIPKNNIKIYDLHKKMSYEELKEYDVVYFCSGDCNYLLKRINEIEFNNVLKKFIENNKVFVGVGAGSIIACENLENNLGFVNCKLSVHCEKGSKAGKMINTKNCPNISLTNSQALIVEDKKVQIVE